MRIELALLAALVAAVSFVDADIERLKDLESLYKAARKLESARMQVTELRAGHAESRARLIYAFIFEMKSTHCVDRYKQIQNIAESFREKAYEYVANPNDKGWFGGLKKLVGPMAHMRYLGRAEKELGKITQRYESQTSSGILKKADVDCDLSKFKIANLDKMLFVLEMDVKYLIMENPRLNNIAIYRQLAEKKFQTESNFYELDKLSTDQQRMLLEFYASRVDLDLVTIGTAVEHFYEPGNLIVGRLLDSCTKLLDFRARWKDEEARRAKSCAESLSDLNNESFASQFPWNRYDTMANFCEDFLRAL